MSSSENLFYSTLKPRHTDTKLRLGNAKCVERSFPSDRLPLTVQEYTCNENERLVAVLPAFGKENAIWMFFEENKDKEYHQPPRAIPIVVKVFLMHFVQELKERCPAHEVQDEIDVILTKTHGFTRITLSGKEYLLPPVQSFQTQENNDDLDFIYEVQKQHKKDHAAIIEEDERNRAFSQQQQQLNQASVLDENQRLQRIFPLEKKNTEEK